MSVNWIDTTRLPFRSLLLLERVQISWLEGYAPEKELTLSLRANPDVE